MQLHVLRYLTHFERNLDDNILSCQLPTILPPDSTTHPDPSFTLEISSPKRSKRAFLDFVPKKDQ